MSDDGAEGGPERTPRSAGSFRSSRRRRTRRNAAVAVALVALSLLGFTLLVGPDGRLGPGSGPAGGGSSSGNLTIDLGAPVVATTTCADGESTPLEAVPWLSASPSVTTDEVGFQLVELIDGDVDGGALPVPSVTATSLCGAPLVTPWVAWYVVLESPTGADLADFTYSHGWIDVDGVSGAQTIPNGSQIDLLSDPASFAHLSFGLCVVGNLGAPTVNVCAQL